MASDTVIDRLHFVEVIDGYDNAHGTRGHLYEVLCDGGIRPVDGEFLIVEAQDMADSLGVALTGLD